MSINKFNKNIISNFNIENVYTVLPSIDSKDFYFVIPVIINRRKSLNLKKLQIICQNQESFKNSFSNMFFSDTLDYKQYSNNKNLDMLGNIVHKNIFLNYNSKNSKKNNAFFEEVFFDTSHYEYNSNEDGFESNPNLYNIILPVSLSKKLVSNNINNIRIIGIDEKNIVLDETDIHVINFSYIKNNNQRIDTQAFYKNYFLNQFIDTLSIKLNRSKIGNSVIISSNSEIDNRIFKTVDINLTYYNGKKSIQSKNMKIETKNYPFEIKNDIDALSLTIAKDLLDEQVNDFIISLNFKFNFIDKPGFISSRKNFISLNKEITFSSNSLFVRNCFESNSKKLFSRIMKSLKLRQDCKLMGNKLELKLSVSNSINDNILKKIYVKDIKKNNSSLDFIYTNSDTTLENKLFYKGKSLFDLFNTNTNFNKFYCTSTTRENNLSIIISFLDKDKKYNSKKIISRDDYSSNIEKVNKLFKNNIQIDSINLNTSLSLENKSIFNYKNIILTNINRFNDISYSFGYIDGDKANISSFLENCLIKIENITNINELNLTVNKTNYYFFNEVFNVDTIDSNIVKVRNEYLRSYIETDDFFTLTRTKNNSINKNFINFFTSQDTENSFKHIIKEESLNLENHLSIKVLPIPRIIANFRGYGLDLLKNPIDTNLYDDISNVTSIKNRLSRELVMFLYSGNHNLNWEKFIKYKEILFNSQLTNDASNYSEFFDDIIELNVSDYDCYTNKTSYDRNEVLNIINVDNIFINSSIHTSFIEENLSSNYFNFSLSNREIFCDSLPYTIAFKNVVYDSNKNEYKPGSIDLFRSSNSSIKIDISYLENFYDKSSILDVEPLIRSSLHIMTSNYDNNININTDNTDFVLASISGKSYLTYNKRHLDKNRTIYSNFNDTIDNSLISIDNDRNKSIINIDINNDYIDLNNIKYENFIKLLEYSKNNGLNYIEKIIVRFSVSFDIPNSEDCISSVFYKEVPYINLNRKKINLNNINKINSLIVTE